MKKIKIKLLICTGGFRLFVCHLPNDIEDEKLVDKTFPPKDDGSLEKITKIKWIPVTIDEKLDSEFLEGIEQSDLLIELMKKEKFLEMLRKQYN